MLCVPGTRWSRPVHERGNAPERPNTMELQPITYGTHTIDPAALPTKSVQALIARGIAHYLGNEQASKVASAFDGVEGVTDEQKSAKKAELQALAVKALVDGTIGTRAVGPRGSTVDTVMRALAKAEVIGILKHNKLSFPTGDKKVKFPDGTELSGADLIDRRIAKHGERLRKEAEVKMKADERKAAKEGEDLAGALL